MWPAIWRTGWDAEGSPFVLSNVVEVDMETARGRPFGKDSVLLADFPWEFLGSFRRAPTSRTQEALGDILAFKQQNTVLRPNALFSLDASEQWVANPGSEENQFQEYVTAAEEDAKEMEEQDPVAPLEDADQGDQADILCQMQARLLELEARAVTAQSKAAPSLPSRNLFGTQPQGNLSTATWSKLQAAAGPAPLRLGRFEAGSRAGHPRMPATQDNFLEAEIEAEAVAKDELTSLVATMTDPMQKILAPQLKQNQDLLARVLPKQQDSIATALSGLGNEGGSSSTGVRGCTAREAYLKQMEDHSMVARCVLQNAMKDMGVSTPYPGLMRDYLERRVPLGEMKLLTLFGYFLAHAWETAFLAQDEIFLGFASRGLMMVEQAAMDGGKTQMGWLLTALPEPNWALVKQKSQKARHTAVCQAMPAIVDCGECSISQRSGLLGQQDAILRQQAGEGFNTIRRARQVGEKDQEAMAQGKGQGRSRRRRRRSLFRQSVNPELCGTMSSTSCTADGCFAGRVVTEEAFERDIASFDACGQPLSDKFSSPAKDPPQSDNL